MTDQPDYSEKRFLVVDDEVFMLGLIERVLKGFNAKGIQKATDGAVALRTIKDDMSQVDCIISDFNMKPVNGLQLLQAIRMGVNPRIPRDQNFIMLTGHGETEVVKTAVMLDVNGYLVKPVSPAKLDETLKRTFKKPIDIKEAEYYKSIDVKSAQAFNTADSGAAKAWVILPRKSIFKNKEEIAGKIAKFKSENATRDGEDNEVKIKNRRQCDIAELKDGMILAEDIEAEEGTVLLRKGTFLTTDIINRLREFAIETQTRNHIWIGDLS